MTDEPAATAGTSARALARLAGVLYLIPAAPFAEFFVREKLIVHANPAATANHIVAHAFLWRLGGLADLFAAASDATLAVIFFALLAHVSFRVALLSALFRLVHVGMLAVTAMLHFAALSYVVPGGALQGVAPELLQVHAFAALRLRGIGFNVALVFFGFACLALGWLFWRSRLVPRFIAFWLGLAGVGYLVNSTVTFLAPAYGSAVFQWVLVPCGLGELALALWLLVFGVREEPAQQPRVAGRATS